MAKFQHRVYIALIFYSWLSITLVLSMKPKNSTQDDFEDDLTLRLVSTVFRHGDRTIDRSSRESYPNDPYMNHSFYPDGEGQLTNTGKKRAYELGMLLRNKYNSFLGNVYYPPNVYARSTSITRTKMTLQLVLAALYPPVDRQKWHSELLWQPVDMIYFSSNDDALLFPILCPAYLEIYKNVMQSAEVKEEIKKFDNLMKTLSKHTGYNITNITGLATLYATLNAELHMGLNLPEWTKDIFPNGELLDASLLFFKLFSYNQLNNLNGGVLLNRIIDDMDKVMNGSIVDRNINLFSGHDLNVAALLHALNISESYLPAYTSSVIIELHEKNEKYFVKVLYYLGIPSKILEVTIPGCEVLCPYDKFIQLTESVKAFQQPCHPANLKVDGARTLLTPFDELSEN